MTFRSIAAKAPTPGIPLPRNENAVTGIVIVRTVFRAGNHEKANEGGSAREGKVASVLTTHDVTPVTCWNRPSPTLATRQC